MREGQIEACEELVRVLTELGSDIEEGEDEMEFDDLEFSTPLACLIKWCFAFAGDREGIHALERVRCSVIYSKVHKIIIFVLSMKGSNAIRRNKSYLGKVVPS